MGKKGDQKGQQEDLILSIGADGKKGDDNFKEYIKDEQRLSDIKRNVVLNELDKKRERLGYHNFLSETLLNRLLSYIDLESRMGWKLETKPSEKGVVMELTSPRGRMFRSAFLVTRDPLLDLNAIDNFAVRADLTIEKTNKETIFV